MEPPFTLPVGVALGASGGLVAVILVLLQHYRVKSRARDRVYTIMLDGESGAGKTSLARYFQTMGRAELLPPQPPEETKQLLRWGPVPISLPGPRERVASRLAAELVFLDPPGAGMSLVHEAPEVDLVIAVLDPAHVAGSTNRFLTWELQDKYKHFWQASTRSILVYVSKASEEVTGDSEKNSISHLMEQIRVRLSPLYIQLVFADSHTGEGMHALLGHIGEAIRNSNHRSRGA